MTTTSKNGTSTADCKPCTVPAFCRNNYYTGKLLMERDFSDEQLYHAGKLRLHYMALHGWGLVCGLTVHPHPHCPSLRIVVEEGLGIDDCGREVRMLKDMELLLPQPDPHKKPPEPCPPDPTTPAPPAAANLPGEATPPPDPNDPKNPYDPNGGGYCEPGPQTEDLYVCIRYCENSTEFTPAPFDDCGCNANGQQPNRICETYELKIFVGEPDFMKKVHEHRHCCEEANCIDIYKRILKECRQPCHCIDWLPLAVIKGFIPGEPVKEEMIDNWSVRPLLPSTRMLDHLIQCILEHLPPSPLTTITDFNWGHGEAYHCREFLNSYVYKQDSNRGFVITFSDPVHPDGINTNSFQATIVRTPQKPEQGRHTEIAPAIVTVAPDGLSCTLAIDSNYAHGSLDGQNFDVFIRLRCDVIVDERGYAVDGNLLARWDGGSYLVNGPSGDGIPGGLFESWIQVRMAAPKRL